MTIEGIEITGDSVANAIRKYYPAEIGLIEKEQLLNYVLMFGIRVATCDTSKPDDVLGAIRLNKNAFGGTYWEMIITEGSVDPSPQYLKKTIDEAARRAGGTAWVKEGKYVYYLMSTMFQGFPAFAPKPGNPVSVYRWMPKYAGEKFDSSKATLSTSVDTLIHRSWNKTAFKNDSAGCQVFLNNALLFDLEKWAKKHIKIYNNLNSFSYTLLTKNQFVNANQKSDFYDTYINIYNQLPPYVPNPFNNE